MDATFGAAIQTFDKSLRALSMGVNRLFYHQGTINQGTRSSVYSSNFPALIVWCSILQLVAG